MKGVHMEASVQATESGMKARWTRLATLGFAMAAAAPLLMVIAGAAFGLDLSDATFLVIPIVVLGIASFLVWRFGTWAKVVAIALGVAGFMYFWLIFGLLVPGSFFDFVPGVLYMPGLLLGIGSCVAAMRAQKRGLATSKAAAGEARGIRIVAAVVAVLVVLSGILTLTGRSSADPAGADAQVALKDFEFVPDALTVPGGSTIYIENDDPFLHTFTIEALGIDEAFTVGSSKLIDIPSEPGSYVFRCEPHSSDPPDLDGEDMAGTLTIT